MNGRATPATLSGTRACQANCSATAPIAVTNGASHSRAVSGMASNDRPETAARWVAAVEMAVADYGGKVAGVPIQVVSADHQNKPDVGVNIARNWYDNEKVDAILDVPTSSVALPISALTREKNKINLNSGGGSSDITGPACSPNTVHWTYDTYALSNVAGKAMVNTTPITRSISNDTTKPAAISAISPGGKASNQIIAVRSIRNSAASSLASNIACSMSFGAVWASSINSLAFAPRLSNSWPGSLKISCTCLMASHTPVIAAQLPASTPLPIALEVDRSQCGLKPFHCLRSQLSRSAVKPS